MIKRDLRDMVIFIPFICCFFLLILAADKTGKVGIIGTIITLFINPENYEIRYNKKINQKLKLRIFYLKELMLSFFCSYYIVYIINHIRLKKEITWPVNVFISATIFSFMWIYVRIIVPHIINYFNNNFE
ncbi:MULTISPECIES: hypothetical protein [Enterococcus]|uniref:Uncharacterized protein n=1 Tax=Enterococcus alishanensis TaxID=1303817 RepID=A0ABS6TE95_9ENTE|nr:hypothetical protein [Enterococcus alishanensis]